MSTVVHHRCGKKVTLVGERLGDGLCQCISKPPAVHHQFGCNQRLKAGAKVTKYLRAITCGRCIRELHVEELI